MKDDNDIVCGFVMGYFKQYDDIVGYTLEEIIISYQYQNKGLGSILLATLETKSKKLVHLVSNFKQLMMKCMIGIMEKLAILMQKTLL